MLNNKPIVAGITMDGNVNVAFDLSKKEHPYVNIKEKLSPSEYTVANNIQIGKFKACYIEFLEHCVAEAKLVNRIASQAVERINKRLEARFVIRLFGKTLIWK